MTVKEFTQICRQIVMLAPYDKCNQLDTFAFVGDLSALERDDLGLTREDYTEGVFWSRRYVNSGKSKMTSGWPKLIVDIGEYDAKCCDTEVVLSIWDKVRCSECGCSKNELQVKQDILSVMSDVVNKILVYRQRFAEDGSVIWSIDGTLQPTGANGIMRNHIKLTDTRTEVIHYGFSGMYFAQITLKVVVDCNKDLIFSNFDDVPELGIVKCNECE